MASVVAICNTALAHIGDAANVTSIDPPEGSAQAERCALFYPLARDALLERHAWGFATRTVNLALMSASALPEWQYAYSIPADCLLPLDVLPQRNTSVVLGPVYTSTYYPQPVVVRPSIDFERATTADGVDAIFTNEAEARLSYVARVADTTKFSALFTAALTHALAARLAGPSLKGDVGAAEAKRQLGLAEVYLEQAKAADALQLRRTAARPAPWVSAR